MFQNQTGGEDHWYLIYNGFCARFEVLVFHFPQVACSVKAIMIFFMDICIWTFEKWFMFSSVSLRAFIVGKQGYAEEVG